MQCDNTENEFRAGEDEELSHKMGTEQSIRRNRQENIRLEVLFSSLSCFTQCFDNQKFYKNEELRKKNTRKQFLVS